MLLVFLLMHATPGNPWDRSGEVRALINITLDTATRENLNRHFGLDKPLWRQFTGYIIGDIDENGDFQCGLVCGNMGPSYRQIGRTVQEILFQPAEGQPWWKTRFTYSLLLAFVSFLLMILIGVPVGISSALKENSGYDRFSTMATTIAMSIPNFVVGLLLIIILASGLGLISVRATWSNPKDWIVPAFVLALSPAAMLARITRTSMLEALHEDYIRTARSKGLTEYRIITLHVFKNALIPVVTFLGPAFIELIAGSFVIEALFGYPGMGREYWESINARDYSMILGVTVLYGIFIALANLFVDLAYSLLDPRIRTG
jgi:ABC-type dipeptide/oligopeptide/nickel transport system permease component